MVNQIDTILDTWKINFLHIDAPSKVRKKVISNAIEEISLQNLFTDEYIEEKRNDATASQHLWINSTPNPKQMHIASSKWPGDHQCKIISWLNGNIDINAYNKASKTKHCRNCKALSNTNELETLDVLRHCPHTEKVEPNDNFVRQVVNDHSRHIASIFNPPEPTNQYWKTLIHYIEKSIDTHKTQNSLKWASGVLEIRMGAGLVGHDIMFWNMKKTKRKS